MKKFTFVLVLLISSFGYAQNVGQSAVDFIYQLDSVPETAYDNFLDVSFKEKVKKEDMIKMWGQIETMFGDFQSVSYICSNEINASKTNFCSG